MEKLFNMSDRTDNQLIEMVTFSKDQYEESAISAAELEIERRKISNEAIDKYIELRYTKDVAEVDKSELRFSWHHKVLTVLSPFIIGAIFHLLFTFLELGREFNFIRWPLLILVLYLIHKQIKKNGYTAMAKDFIGWLSYTLYGLIALMLIIALIFLLVN